LYQLFLQNPTTQDSNIVSLKEYVDFIAHVADCYLDLTTPFPDHLISLLVQHHASLDTELREKIVTSLVILRNKNVIDSVKLLNALFPILIATHSKTLRAFIFTKIIADIRASNTKTTNHKLNRTFQNTLFTLVTADPASSNGLWSVKLTREFWKRQIWTDAKAVDIMKEAALSDNQKVVVGGVRFFLGGDKEREDHEDESSDDDAIDMSQLRHQLGINKKTKKRARDLKKATVTVRKKEKKKKTQTHLLNFSALHLLHDPQGFAERLFSKHLQNTKSKLNLEQKLYVLQLVTRLVGLHQLTLESLYSYFLKYLTPRQPSVTTFLACAAQSSHNLVPPELLSPIVTKIANEFVSEASASEVASAGLNGIREICLRQPLAMDDTLLQDLVQYRKSKDKGVTMAAKGLLSLYRNVGAELLNKKDRGKDAALGIRDGTRMTKFGEQQIDDDISGIELLELWKEEERAKKRLAGELHDDDEENEDKLIEEEEAEGWKNWDVEDDDSDGEEGWIDVASDGEDFNISDSDDDRPTKKNKTNGTEAETSAEANLLDASTPASTTISINSKKSTMATTRILTPADLLKLRELQQKSAIEGTMRNPRAEKPTPVARHVDDGLTAAEIEGLASLSHKSTKEERVAKGREGKEDKHVSSAALRKERKNAQGKSSTNKEKQREKNFFMTLRKAKNKGRRSLTEVRKVLKGHVHRAKHGGKRGNAGN
jgi:protein SDA1